MFYFSKFSKISLLLFILYVYSYNSTEVFHIDSNDEIPDSLYVRSYKNNNYAYIYRKSGIIKIDIYNPFGKNIIRNKTIGEKYGYYYPISLSDNTIIILSLSSSLFTTGLKISSIGDIIEEIDIYQNNASSYYGYPFSGSRLDDNRFIYVQNLKYYSYFIICSNDGDIIYGPINLLSYSMQNPVVSFFDDYSFIITYYSLDKIRTNYYNLDYSLERIINVTNSSDGSNYFRTIVLDLENFAVIWEKYGYITGIVYNINGNIIFPKQYGYGYNPIVGIIENNIQLLWTSSEDLNVTFFNISTFYPNEIKVIQKRYLGNVFIDMITSDYGTAIGWIDYNYTYANIYGKIFYINIPISESTIINPILSILILLIIYFIL